MNETRAEGHREDPIAVVKTLTARFILLFSFAYSFMSSTDIGYSRHALVMFFLPPLLLLLLSHSFALSSSH